MWSGDINIEVRKLGGFFKRQSRDDAEGINRYNEMDVINSVSGQLIAERNISGVTDSIITNRLPDMPRAAGNDMFLSFNGYMFFSESDRGMVRENNQDAAFSGSYRYNAFNRALSMGIGIVADGMGGLSKGEVASSIAVTSVSTYMYARMAEYVQANASMELPHSQVVLGHISESMQNANKLIWDRGFALGDRIGTTFTGVFLMGRVAYFGHVGDSRAYLIDTSNGSMDRVSRDHSLVGRLVEMGQISEAEAKSHPRRNEIYKTLGLNEVVEADTYYRMINMNSIILLMSDGLWEFVDDAVMLQEIKGSRDLAKSAKVLVDMAKRNGGHDNITIMIIKPF
jgi:serine/threonine protein phosphatase PrpC